MPGRYEFSLPGPKLRDGWFRVGQVDITTTVMITLAGVASMFVYAIDKAFLFKGVFSTELVREGEVWRLATWPLVNPPTDLWMILGLLFFWYFGREVEERMERIPYTVMVVAATILPAAIVTVINAVNHGNSAVPFAWSTAAFSVDLLGLAMFVIFALDNPRAQSIIPAPFWAIAAFFVGWRALLAVADRAWATLILMALVLVVSVFGARQRRMLDELEFIPRFRSLAGHQSPYGTPPSARSSRRTRRSRHPNGRRPNPRGGTGGVVAGPWKGSDVGSASGAQGLTPLEQAELDTLLDLIGANGIDSLTKAERSRLNELSNRMRGA